MKVKKRSGEVHNFNSNKILTSIINASDDVKEPLNESDVDMVSREIIKKLKETNKEIVDSREIFEIIYSELMVLGFKDVAESYKDGTGR